MADLDYDQDFYDEEGNPRPLRTLAPVIAPPQDSAPQAYPVTPAMSIGAPMLGGMPGDAVPVQSQAKLAQNIAAPPSVPIGQDPSIPKAMASDAVPVSATPKPPPNPDAISSGDSSLSSFANARPVAAPPIHYSRGTRALGMLGAGLASFGKGPEAGQQVIDNYFKAPQERADKQLAQAQADYDAKQAAARQAGIDDLNQRNVESEIKTRENPPEKDREITPEQQGFKDTYDDALKAGKTHEQAYQSAMAAGAKPEKAAEADKPLGTDEVGRVNQAMTARYNILHPGATLPPYFTLPTNATRADYERIDKALEANERANGTKAQQDAANEMRRQTFQFAQSQAEDRKAAGTNKVDTATRKEVMAVYQPALDADGRMRIMEQNAADAKKGDQQAMTNLVAQHVLLSMGIPVGKVGRPNQQLFNDVIASDPILSRMTSKFDKDGYLSGVTLAPDQIDHILRLGKENRDMAWDKGKNAANFITPGFTEHPNSLYDESGKYVGPGGGKSGGGANATTPAGGHPAGADNEVLVKGKVVGHTVNGKYVPLGK